MRSFSVGSVIYKADWTLSQDACDEAVSLNIPPLLWLLGGAIEHRWSNPGDVPKWLHEWEQARSDIAAFVRGWACVLASRRGYGGERR